VKKESNRFTRESLTNIESCLFNRSAVEIKWIFNFKYYQMKSQFELLDSSS